MTKFLMDVAAVMLGVALIALMFSIAAADTATKVYCDVTTNGPFNQTACIVNHTLK